MSRQQQKEQIIAFYNKANPELPFPAALDEIDVYDNPMMGGEDEQYNTTSYLTAKEESAHFTGSMVIRYNRLDTGIVDETIHDDLSKWEDDEYVLSEINKRLQRKFPDDSFEADELMVSRDTNEANETVVSVMWMTSIKFLPANIEDFSVKLTILPTDNKTDLSTTNGELNGFTQ